MPQMVSISVAGAGQIGRSHIAAIRACDECRLHAIVDPAPAARTLAQDLGVAWFATIAEMLERSRPDGVVLATPNQLHVEHGMACVEAGIAALVEKPFATDVASGRRLVDAAAAGSVPLLTGHHRRHNPLIAAARDRIVSGALGAIVSVHAMFWMMKPDDYFDTPWRRQPGAGPVFLNLIHDIDLLRHLVGEIVEVQAIESNGVRSNPVEETAVVLLRFAGGALGTVNVSDSVVAPWSWELTARENPVYPATEESCYFIGGTHGSLELPGVGLWANTGRRSWHEPIAATRYPISREDPLLRQIHQFAAVIRGEEVPLVSGLEGLKTLAVIEAVKMSARTRAPVCPEIAA